MSPPVLLNPYRAGGGAGSAYDALMATLSPSFYLKLDEASGTTAFDSSGNSRDFTNGGVPTATVNQTKVRPNGGTSYDFNGTTARLAQASAAYMNTSTFSITSWIRPDTASGALRCIASRDKTAAGWALYLDSTGKLNAFFPGAGNSHLGTAVLSAATPYFVCMTCNVAATETKLYIDGALDATIAAVPLVATVNEFRIGNSHGSNNTDSTNVLFFDGRIDDLSFHADTVLTDTNVSDLMAAA